MREMLMDYLKQSGIEMSAAAGKMGMTWYQFSHLLQCGPKNEEEYQKAIEAIDKAKKQKLTQAVKPIHTMPEPMAFDNRKQEPQIIRRGLLFKASEYVIAKSKGVVIDE